MILFRLAIARVLPIIVNRRPRRLIPTGISLCLWSPWKFTSPSTSAYSINTLAYTYIYIYVYPGFKRSFSRPDLWSKIVRSVIKVLSLGRKFCPSLSLSFFRLLLRYRADNSFIFFNVSKNIASPRVYLLLTEQTFPFPFRRRLYLRQVLERNKQNRLRSFGPVNNVLLYFPPIFSYIYS